VSQFVQHYYWSTRVLRAEALYSFKIPPQAVIEEVEDEGTGQRRFRYINKARFVGFTPTRIGHIHDPSDVPTEPPKSVLPILPRLDQALLDKMRAVRVVLLHIQRGRLKMYVRS
jgi:hypothetical protein